MKRYVQIVALVAIIAIVTPASAQIQWGRDLTERNTAKIALTLGSIFGLDGEVQETTRPIEEIGGPTSGSPPEDYSWKELGFDDAFFTAGLTGEKMWRFVTLGSSFKYGSPSVSGTADRDYYIGVGTVKFEGESYEYMVIPEGERYSGDIDLYSLAFTMQITPFSIGSADVVSFTPFLHLGLFTFIADYEIDAGPAREVTQYENPPRDYVVGGKGSGTTGLVVPEIGLGAELTIAMGSRARLNLQGHAAIFEYKGGNSNLGVSSRNEKVVDVSYKTFMAQAYLEIALNKALDLILGLEFQHWTGDAEVRAKDRAREEVLTRREKFDKDVRFEMYSVMGILGLRY